MKKDFWKWHEKKGEVNEAEGTALFHEREVWWCTLGTNIGFEQDGSGVFPRPPRKKVVFPHLAMRAGRSRLYL